MAKCCHRGKFSLNNVGYKSSRKERTVTLMFIVGAASRARRHLSSGPLRIAEEASRESLTQISTSCSTLDELSPKDLHDDFTSIIESNRNERVKTYLVDDKTCTILHHLSTQLVRCSTDRTLPNLGGVAGLKSSGSRSIESSSSLSATSSDDGASTVPQSLSRSAPRRTSISTRSSVSSRGDSEFVRDLRDC